MDGERLAQLVAEKARQDPKVEKILTDARLFDELQENLAWKQLRDYVVSRYDRWMLSLSKRIMRGEEVSQREIDYHRGFYDGAKYAVLIPEVALANLERVAREAWKLQDSEETDDQEWSPYL